jgi:hypothetical protein
MHRHHIIPKHMGGSDDPSNLETITVTEHAERHKVLYFKYGKIEDYVAWKSLSEQIDKEELIRLTSSIGGKNNKGKPKSLEQRRKMSESASLPRSPLSEIRKEKISDAMVGNTNSKNHSSEEYRSKQSQTMKDAWARRKKKENA